MTDPNADTQVHIPEFKREVSGGPPFIGIAVIAILVIAGIGLLVFALVYGQGDAENRAISGTVGAVLSFTHTPTETRSASSTPVPTFTSAPSDTPTVSPTDTSAPTQGPAATDTLTATSTKKATQAVFPTDTPAPPSPTHTSAPAELRASKHGLTGQLTLCNPEKPTFATNIERVCFRELIVNNSSAPIAYGVLGVQATNLSGGPSQFQTSWRGELIVGPGAVGPTAGGWEDGMYIASPGTYRLTLSICYSDVDTCLGSNGDWETLTTGVNVTVVDWTPSP